MRGRASGSCPPLINGTSRYQLLQLSRHPAPVGSLPAFTWGNVVSERNPYSRHYSETFAFSDILYPHPYRFTLQLTFPKGEIRAYHVPRKYQPSDLGSILTPAVHHLR